MSIRPDARVSRRGAKGTPNALHCLRRARDLALIGLRKYQNQDVAHCKLPQSNPHQLPHATPFTTHTTAASCTTRRRIHRHRNHCRVLGVAPNGYYAWLKQPLSNRAREDARLLRLIQASFTASHGTYGVPCVLLGLRESGETCSKHRVVRLMRGHQLRALHGHRTRGWVVGKLTVPIPNLLKPQFTATRPNTAWVTYITYIRTWQGWLYLAVPSDLLSRKIVGWSTGPTIHRELILNALLMAVRQRRPRCALI